MVFQYIATVVTTFYGKDKKKLNKMARVKLKQLEKKELKESLEQD